MTKNFEGKRVLILGCSSSRSIGLAKINSVVLSVRRPQRIQRPDFFAQRDLAEIGLGFAGKNSSVEVGRNSRRERKIYSGHKLWLNIGYGIILSAWKRAMVSHS